MVITLNKEDLNIIELNKKREENINVDKNTIEEKIKYLLEKEYDVFLQIYISSPILYELWDTNKLNEEFYNELENEGEYNYLCNVVHKYIKNSGPLIIKKDNKLTSGIGSFFVQIEEMNDFFNLLNMIEFSENTFIKINSINDIFGLNKMDKKDNIYYKITFEDDIPF